MSNNPAHPLDNPFWSSLTSGHAHLSTGTDRAKRYLPGLVEAVSTVDNSDAAFADLYQLVAPGETVAIIKANPPDSLPGFTIYERAAPLQMVREVVAPEPDVDADVIDLTVADLPDMADLVALTKPGPFGPRCFEMGPFVGIRVDGRLVSMAGQRLRPAGYVEVCTVCTHPDFQGRGYARLLSSRVAADIARHGEIPCLHVSPGNYTAQRLYESLGFRLRRQVSLLIFGRE